MKIIALAPIFIFLIQMGNSYKRLKQIRKQVTHNWDVLRLCLNDKFRLAFRLMDMVKFTLTDERQAINEVSTIARQGLSTPHIKVKLDKEKELDKLLKVLLGKFTREGGKVNQEFMDVFNQYKEAKDKSDARSSSYNKVVELYNSEARQFPVKMVVRFSRYRDYPVRQKSRY